ncbi:hypothetical protein CCYN49044_180131 [Capnocytophaga cynodegmi]|uniref:Uncharacterized protein n=1 Tax=Capnocytophaga cynodegmi TaxID=28189 RepID=A0A0B7HAB0_9FLAO|nr:hypothetical protein CCYN74_140044 [Capnocytophaga cynodegmi]CEN36591.1 hypothetical protein CCYN49044_180131 [Capnocytophaga cynodegmi]
MQFLTILITTLFAYLLTCLPRKQIKTILYIELLYKKEL